MDMFIKSRKGLEEFASNPFPERTAIISIADYGTPFPELKHRPHHLLQVSFDDVGYDTFQDEFEKISLKSDQILFETKHHIITDEIAKQITDFFFTIRNHVDFLILQSEHGKSRSAAIAAAILQHVGGGGVFIFSNDKYNPNKVVFRKVFRMMKLPKYDPEL